MATSYPKPFNHQKVSVASGANDIVFPLNTHNKVSIVANPDPGATATYQYTYSTPEDVTLGNAVWSTAVNAAADAQTQLDAPVTALKIASASGASVFTILG